VQPRDIESLQSVSGPSLDPDGSRVIVSVTHPDLDSDATVGQLWSVPLDGSGPRRITRGAHDSAPAFSPDGRAIAFLRAAPGTPPQLHVMDARGGEPVRLTDQKLGAGDFDWSPDSARIAYTARVAEEGRYGTVEGIAPDAEPARRISVVRYKANGLGYTNDRRRHVFLVDVPPLDAEPPYEPAPRHDGSKPESALVPQSVQVTKGDFDHFVPRFIGDRLGFLSPRHASRDRDLLNQLWVVQPHGSTEPEPLIAPELSIETFRAAPDGSVYLIAQDVGSATDFVGRNSSLYRLDEGVAALLTDPETVDLADGDMPVIAGSVIVPNRARGRVHLLEVQPNGDYRPLSSGDIEISGQDAAELPGTDGSASATRVVVSYTSPDTFGDVAVLENGVLTPVSDFSAALKNTGIVRPVELTVTGRDGYPIHGWVASPAGEGPHPTLLMIHGGPFADYSVHVFDETQVYVEAGYAVVYCNPRGSAGYGQAHGRAIKQAMGTVDLGDVLDFLDGVLDTRSDLDSSRLGILGGSYGGYLTAWTIAHDHRFRAAVVERGYLDPGSFVGSSDIGWFFPHEYNGESPDHVRTQSPQAVVRQVRTPTLVIHSEDDLRCPLGQAENWYTCVKLNGVEAELLVFPGENHELSRSGRPRHRVQRFEAILDWFGSNL
jgi:dipeptidyl aminopeptidase/acylaminoacyl peptidase